MSTFTGVTRTSPSVCLIGLILAIVLVPLTTQAADTNWGAAMPSSWFVGANWTNGMPNGGMTAEIDNGGTCHIHIVNNAFVDTLTVGDDHSGTLDQTTGTLTAQGITIGSNVGSTGLFDLQGGSVTANAVTVGFNGTGTFTQSGGSITLANALYLGFMGGALSAGTYNLSGNPAVVTLDSQETTVGYASTGTFEFYQSGGTHTVTTILYVGRTADGLYEMSWGDLTADTIEIGADVGSGVFTQTGGTVTTTGALWLASNGTGTYKISGGICNVGGNIATGLNAVESSRLIIDGGVLNVSGASITVDSLTIGKDPGSNGSFTLTAGKTLKAYYPVKIGDKGTGTFIQNGGTHEIWDDLYLAYDSTGDGTYDMNGGDLYAADEYVGMYGVGEFTQSAGKNDMSGTLYVGWSTGSDGTYELSGTGQIETTKEYIGCHGTGSFTQDGGTNEMTGSLYIGRYSGSSGTYELNDGTLDVGDDEYMGYYGSGSFTQTGGTHIVADRLLIAVDDMVTATYDMSGSSSLSASEMHVGWRGEATFTQSGGTVTVTTDLDIGTYSTSNATYILSGTGSLSAQTISIGCSGTGRNGQFNFTGGTLDADTININSTGYMKVEKNWAFDGDMNLTGDATVDIMDDVGTYYSFTLDAPGAGATCTMTGSETQWPQFESGNTCIGQNGKGTFTHNDGGHFIVGTHQLGQIIGSQGFYNLHGGNLFVQGSERIGFMGTGSIVHTGGMHSVDDTLTLGCMPGSTGTYNMSEANPENPSDLHANTEFIGKSGGGEFTQSGGHHGAETLYIGYQPGSTGTYTISGGNFDTYDFYIGTGGSGTFAITNAAAVVYVMNLLHFGPDSTFTAVPGSTIHMCGSTFENESIDPTVTGLAGLGNLNLVFGGGTEDVDPVEVAGQDKGAVAAG